MLELFDPIAIATRFTAAVLNWPDRQAWLLMLGLLLGFGAIALPIGFGTGFLTLEPVRQPRAIVSTLLVVLLYPSVAEESVFRLIPIPLTAQANSTTILWLSGLSLLVFIAAHPLNAWLWMTDRRATFFDPVFLSLAGLLGAACTLSYVQSGSLWPAIVLHWAVVVIWLLLLGGDRRMQGLPLQDG